MRIHATRLSNGSRSGAARLLGAATLLGELAKVNIQIVVLTDHSWEAGGEELQLREHRAEPRPPCELDGLAVAVSEVERQVGDVVPEEHLLQRQALGVRVADAQHAPPANDGP